jgi:YgiT-type zinc finger domain-containing protein
MKECSFCGNKNFREDKVEYIYKHSGKMMIVENVPCEVCEYCGEQFYKAEVLKKIEKDFFEIESDKKKPANVKSVPVEEYELSV